jgi:predicted transcriptional regulator
VNIIIHVIVNSQELSKKQVPGMKDVHEIDSLEQVRLLSDPLKLKLLQLFATEPRTTREAAKQLAEGVTKLYRHVDALQEAGLLEIVDEVRKRGTVERRFGAVARRFEVDRDLFSDSGDAAGRQAARDLLRAGEEEIMQALTQAEAGQMPPLMARLRLRVSDERARELNRQLADWIASLEEEPDEPDQEDLQEAGVLIAFYCIPEG